MNQKEKTKETESSINRFQKKKKKKKRKESSINHRVQR